MQSLLRGIPHHDEQDNWGTDIATRWIKETKAVVEQAKVEVEQVKAEANVKAEAERAIEEGIKQAKVATQRAIEEEIKQVKEEIKQREEEWICYLLADAVDTRTTRGPNARNQLLKSKEITMMIPGCGFIGSKPTGLSWPPPTSPCVAIMHGVQI
ncbi:hypothetical protein C5167_051090 [Papaver somniferum]|uniref:Flotillin-like n=1 Tax=Papaver somniferum TaxID=3469 RepID=A0A4Y7KTU7_PAPSO|nr:hypothetical protein C5167_051090 [Papaver somniferum]